MDKSERDAILAKWGIATPNTSATGEKKLLSAGCAGPSGKTLFADGDTDTENVKPLLRGKTILDEQLRNAAELFQDMSGMEEAKAFIPRMQAGGDLRTRAVEAIRAKLPTHGTVSNRAIRNIVQNQLETIWHAKPPAPVARVAAIFGKTTGGA